MKLRIAKKIYKRFDYKKLKYNSLTVDRMFSRLDKCQSYKDINKYWNNLMDSLGPKGIFELSMDLSLTILEEKYAHTISNDV